MAGFTSLSDCKTFWSRTVVSWTEFWNGTPCWNWHGARNTDGYGILGRSLTRDRPFTFAHRLSYAAYKGPIPQGLTIDHLCRNRRCVNPDHLEAVTRIVNVMRGFHPTADNARKTHCKNGHLLADNLKPRKSGARECLACIRDRQAACRSASFGDAWAARNDKIRARYAAMTDQERDASLRKARAALLPRWEIAREKKRIAAQAQPGEGVRKYFDSLTPEQRMARIAPTLTPEARANKSASAIRARAAMTPERKREIAVKAWKTRRENNR